MKFYNTIKYFTFFGVLIFAVSGCRSTCNQCSNLGYDQMFQQTVRQAGEKVFPALVYIRVVQENLDGGSASSASASGSGVIISPRGELITNYHVIDKALSIRCLLNDGRAFDAEIIGSDKDIDLALLKLNISEDTPDLPYAEFVDSAVLEGDFVMALGAPWGLNRSISIGIISCASRYLEGYSEYSLWYQSDAAISPGNSGGPLINTAGRIVGVNTLGRSGHGGSTLAFTIPSDTVKLILPRLRKYGKVNWAWFGLRFQPLRDFERNSYQPYKEGVLIASTEMNSPAQAAGFRANDLLLAINGEAITVETSEGLPALYRKLGLMEFDRDVRFTILRDGQTMDIVCAAAEKGKVEGEEVACDNWGFTAKTINRFSNPELYFYCPEGVFVHGVKPRSSAGRAGLRPGDIIVKVNNQPVKSLAELLEAYKSAGERAGSDRRTVLTIMRNGINMQFGVYWK